jgi:hypothetical protein
MGFRFSGKNHAGQEWRVAGAIETFGKQIEAIRPGSFTTDGTVASKQHDIQNPGSDHRPSPRTGLGVVRAIDFGEPKGSPTFVDEVGESLRVSKDPRIAYFIHNKQIFSSFATKNFGPFEWRPYKPKTKKGKKPNPHTTHGHLSVVAGPLGEQTHEFSIVMGQLPAHAATGTEGSTDDMAFTAEEEAFLKRFVKVVSIDMGSSRDFAKSAILDIRKDIITKDELVELLTGLPQGDVDAAITEMLKRLKK